MASLRTPTPLTDGGQGVVRILKVSSCVTGDTVYYAGPMRAYVSVNLTTADALSCSYSTTTNLFTLVVANTPDVNIIVFM